MRRVLHDQAHVLLVPDVHEAAGGQAVFHQDVKVYLQGGSSLRLGDLGDVSSGIVSDRVAGASAGLLSAIDNQCHPLASEGSLVRSSGGGADDTERV